MGAGGAGRAPPPRARDGVVVAVSLSHVLDLLLVFVVLGTVAAAVFTYEVAPESAFDSCTGGYDSNGQFVHEGDTCPLHEDAPYDWERDGG